MDQMVGIATSHMYNRGGGWQAVKWHLKAFLELGYKPLIFSRNAIHPVLLRENSWLGGIQFRSFYDGCERGFKHFINIDHFAWAQPLAENNYAHVFFPHDELPLPPEGVKLFTNSAYTGRHVQDIWNRDSQVMYIPVDAGYYQLPKERLALHVSRISKPSKWADKGHSQIMEVWRMYQHQLPGWQLLMVGSVDDNQQEYYDYLQTLARGLQIGFIPNPTDEALMSLYARASILFHATGVSMPEVPQAQEHFGLTPLEAAASGVVSMCFNSGGMPEVVLNGKTGTLFSDTRQMGQHLRTMTADWSIWATMQQAAVRHASTFQNFEAFVDRIDAMLNDHTIPDMPPYTTEKDVPGKTDVTIVIPTYNNPLDLNACMTSILNTASGAKILIVNNGTKDGWEFDMDNVTIVEPGKNLGFAKSYKFAHKFIDTKYVLLLNDDVVALNAGWLELMLFEFTSNNVGAVGAKLLFPNGNLQHAGGNLDLARTDVGHHRWYGKIDGPAESQIVDVDFVTAACMLTRTEFLNYIYEDWLLEGLNMEDVHLCLSLKHKHDLRTVYQPGSVLLHNESRTKMRLDTTADLENLNRIAFREHWTAEVLNG